MKGLEARIFICRGVSWLFRFTGASSCGHLKSSQFPRSVRTLCPSLLMGLSICRGESPISEENRSEKLVICNFLLKTKRTASQVFSVQQVVVQ